MSKLIKPEGYKALLDMRQTEMGIKLIKEFFQQNLSTELRLRRVTAPLFVLKGLGINDDLNGVERPVSFPIKDLGEAQAEVVHSLAKWKRLTLAEYNIEPGYGVYTDMNAIRADEELDNLHSLYVDQWDWEMHIDENDRNVMFLRDSVERIYRVLKQTEFFVYDRYEEITPILPQKITFVYSDDLYRLYPNLTPKERENEFCKKHGAIFVIGIGGKLPDGSIHDGRAPDYDDWITESGDGHIGLNGDLLVWNPVSNQAMELSSMGIRVSKESLVAQLKERGCPERAELDFHKKLLSGSLVQTMGGGIGQSRLCMYFLRKAHIGETQVSIWPDSMIDECEKHGIAIL